MARSRNLADIVNLNLQSQITAAVEGQFGHISGLTLTRSAVNQMTIGPGSARNEDGGTARRLLLASNFVKVVTAPWAIGTTGGGLDTGTIAANTWYHIHLIRRDSDGFIDALVSLSPTAPTMPSGFTARRRIGSFRTDGSNQITPFIQNNDLFTWGVPVADVNVTNPGATAVTRALTVPTGVVVFPVVSWQVDAQASTPMGVLVTPLTIADTTPSATQITVRARAGSASGGAVSAVVSDVPTNTSAQVRTRCDSASATDVLRATTLGWIDPRGR